MGTNGINNILTGILIGAFLALLNSYLLYLTVINTLKMQKTKAKIAIGLIYVFKFLLLFGVLFAIAKFTKINFISVAASLGIITLFTPYKLFLRKTKP